MSIVSHNALSARTPATLDLSVRTTARWTVAGIVIVLIITIAIRLYQPTGWLGSDDAAYYSAAEHILTGTPITRAHHHYARMAIIVPVAASVYVFGHHTWAVALPMFLASVVCVILVVMLGRLLFGWREGLLAGLIVSVLPYFRVLSTTAYADTHVCLWVTVSVVFCVLALRAQNNPNPARKRGAAWPVASAAGCVWFIASGFAMGLAISSKVFAATALCGIVSLVANVERNSWRRIATAAGAVACGGLLLFIVEGAFYSHFANDFLFSLHAHEQSQSGVPAMAGESAAATTGLAALIWERLTLLMVPSTSGWGWLGATFWPVVILSFVSGGAARCMALWAAGTFLLIAFAPVSLEGGYQPYPLFHGRHILSACIPFALCVAAVAGRWIAYIEERRPVSVWIPRLWPALTAMIVAISFANPSELRGFRDRPTGRVGDAIRKIIAETDWTPHVPIFMTPSSYWRYRILFPENLRAQLRVTAAADAPDWWLNVTPDIAARRASLQGPENAYLLVTPTQLAGQPESWDYGVGLPEEDLIAWREHTPSLVVTRGSDRKLFVAPQADFSQETVALLLGPHALQTRQAANVPTYIRKSN